MLIVSSMQKNNKTTVSDCRFSERHQTDKGISPPSITDFYEPQFVTALKYKLTNRWMLGEASNAWWHRVLYCRSLLYAAANGEELWTAASLPVGSHFQEAEIQSLGTKHLTWFTQSESPLPAVLTVSKAMFKQRCHFQLNMQRTFKGMLILGFYEMNSPPLTFLHVCWDHPRSITSRRLLWKLSQIHRLS